MKKTKLIILLLFLLIAFKLLTQEINDCVNSHTFEFNSKDNIALKDTYAKYRFFILGEYHFQEENSEIFMTALKNLYYNANVRIIFMETGFATGLNINEFLKTGDKDNLDCISLYQQFTSEHFIKLKKFYDQLPTDQKFKVVGVDLETYDISSNFKPAVERLFKDSIPNYLSVLFNKLTDKSIAYNQNAKTNIFNEIYFDWKTNKPKYSEILGENYDIYSELMIKTKKSCRYEYYDYNNSNDTTKLKRRESYIYRNIISEINENPDCNYFAQFGIAHIGLQKTVEQKKKYEVSSFITKLNKYENSPIKNSVCSFAIIYYKKQKKLQPNIHYALKEFLYMLDRNKYLSNKIYKTLKANTEEGKIYVVDISADCFIKDKHELQNFQYLIFKK